MPNITLYLTDEEYTNFNSLNDEMQSEARKEAIKTLLRITNKLKSQS